MKHTCLTLVLAAAFLAAPAFAQTGEKLDRGAVALRQNDGAVYVGWRLLESDPAGVAFHVYRQTGKADAERLTADPVHDSTNFVDAKTPKEGDLRYFVRAVAGKDEGPPSPAVAPADSPLGSSYLSIKLQGNYVAQKVAVADLDGDGRYELVIKQPDFNTDPYSAPGYWKKSEDTYKLEAYTLDGKLLWRHDMGWSIEEGIWYSPYIAYDLDGDGKAEVYCKGGEGDPRDPDGRVSTGPEWLLKIDGVTGKVVRKIPWISRDGLGDYNYFCRNQMCIAYLDGKHPYLVLERGTYKKIKLEAYDGQLNLVWKWDSGDEKEKYDSQGSHTLHAADVNGDGCDELVVGSCVVDHNGKGLWTLGIGHPDACYVGKIDPALPGLQIFYGIEPKQKSGAVRLVAAATGKTLWANEEPTTHVHSQGMCGRILAEYPGQQCYAGEKDGSQYWLYSAQGKRIGSESIGGLATWDLWWDDDDLKEVILKDKITKFKGAALQSVAHHHCAVADVLGDWREELIACAPGELRIYTTMIPAKTRRPCLMQDRLYRNAVAIQSMGYNAPPQHSQPYTWSAP
jgi:rhamnogalacturonan endolyase